jgi:hypothetical protein
MNKRLNDVTPEEWDRLRASHPAIEKPPMLDSWMRAAHAENSELWEDESLEEAIARQDEEEEPYTVSIPTHYDMTTEEGRQEVWEMFSKVNQDDDDDDDDDDDYEDWDTVNNPTHYNTGNIECIEAIEESMSSVAFKGYLKGNCMKYLWRYDYKGKPSEDLQKAGWYLQKLTAMVTEENS